MSLTNDEVLIYNQELQYLHDQYAELQKEREPIYKIAQDLDIKMEANRKRFREILKEWKSKK